MTEAMELTNNMPNLEGFTAHDIEKEGDRIYAYGNRVEYKIENVLYALIRDDDKSSHRIIDKDGICHIPHPHWVAIR